MQKGNKQQISIIQKRTEAKQKGKKGRKRKSKREENGKKWTCPFCIYFASSFCMRCLLYPLCYVLHVVHTGLTMCWPGAKRVGVSPSVSKFILQCIMYGLIGPAYAERHADVAGQTVPIHETSQWSLLGNLMRFIRDVRN